MAHYFFNLDPPELSPVESGQVDLMVDYVQAAVRSSEGRDPSFTFPAGRSRDVAVFKLYERPLRLLHRPLVFYFHTVLFTQVGNWSLAIRGFRHFGHKEPFFAWYWMRCAQWLARGRTPTDLLAGVAIRTAFRVSPKKTAGRRKRRAFCCVRPKQALTSAAQLPYWFWPGRKGHEKDTPFVFFHGMSGSYGPTPFLLALAWITGRPIFLPEYPIVFMRSASPRTIVAREETVAAIRFALTARGFDRCISVGHSLGTAPAAWLLHDCVRSFRPSTALDSRRYAARGRRKHRLC